MKKILKRQFDELRQGPTILRRQFHKLGVHRLAHADADNSHFCHTL